MDTELDITGFEEAEKCWKEYTSLSRKKLLRIIFRSLILALVLQVPVVCFSPTPTIAGLMDMLIFAFLIVFWHIYFFWKREKDAEAFAAIYPKEARLLRKYSIM